MRNAPIVAGTPSPYSIHVHPLNTRFHNGNWTLPVFGAPVIARPADVFTPSYNIDRNMPQPTLSGLGEINSSWDTGSGIFRPGGYGGGVFDGDIAGLGSLGTTVFQPAIRHQKHRRMSHPGYSIRGLGDDSADYPWKTKSAKTTALQQATNVSLAKAGMCPLTVDGKLGGATCGARNFLTANSTKLFGQEMDFSNPSTCDGHDSELVRPSTTASGCGAGGASRLPTTSAPPVIEAGMSSSTKRALGFAVGGILAIGAVVLMRKKK